MSSFSDPQAIARYAEGPVRLVPGFHALQEMTSILLAERVGATGRVLVLGAGGGLELKLFAERHPDWRFLGVDPSTEMLALARTTLGPLASHVDFYVSYINTAPVEQLMPPRACSRCTSCLPRNDCARWSNCDDG